MHDRLEVLREGRFQLQTGTVNRMIEAELAGMQHLPSYRRPLDHARTTISRVTKQRMSSFGEMDTDLMGTPGRNLDFDQTGAIVAGYPPVAGQRRLAASFHRDHAVGCPTTRQLRPHLPFVILQVTGHQCQVSLGNPVFAESGRQAFVCPGMRGKNQDSTGVAVKPLYHAEADLPGIAEKLLECGIYGSLVTCRRRLGGNPCRLVQRQQVLITVYDHRRIEAKRFKWQPVDMELNVLSCSNRKAAAAHSPTVDMCSTKIDHTLDHAASSLQSARKEQVEPKSGLIAGHDKTINTRGKQSLFHGSRDRIEKFRDAA